MKETPYSARARLAGFTPRITGFSAARRRPRELSQPRFSEMEALSEGASLSDQLSEKARCELDDGYSPPAADGSLAARFGAWGAGVCTLIGRWLAYNTADESACLASLEPERVPALVEFIFELGIDYGQGTQDADYDRAVITKMVNKRLPAAYYEGHGWRPLRKGRKGK